jgi:hypothetical protein
MGRKNNKRKIAPGATLASLSIPQLRILYESAVLEARELYPEWSKPHGGPLKRVDQLTEEEVQEVRRSLAESAVRESYRKIHIRLADLRDCTLARLSRMDPDQKCELVANHFIRRRYSLDDIGALEAQIFQRKRENLLGTRNQTTPPNGSTSEVVQRKKARPLSEFTRGVMGILAKSPDADGMTISRGLDLDGVLDKKSRNFEDRYKGSDRRGLGSRYAKIRKKMRAKGL